MAGDIIDLKTERDRIGLKTERDLKYHAEIMEAKKRVKRAETMNPLELRQALIEECLDHALHYLWQAWTNCGRATKFDADIERLLEMTMATHDSIKASPLCDEDWAG
jgi:hypothetical protein